VETCLLHHVPRAVSAPPDVLAVVPGGLTAAIAWLGVQGLLDARRAQELAAVAAELTEKFEALADDETRWGPAKALVMSMMAAGTNMSDPAEIQRFVDAENARRAAGAGAGRGHQGGRAPRRRR
jgi:hypothetical protein